MQTRNRKKELIFFFLSFFIFNLNLSAEEFDITAKEVLIDKENEILLGKGSVRAEDSEGKIINADKITYEKSREFLLAEGNVKIIDGEQILTSSIVIINQDQNKIILPNTKVSLSALQKSKLINKK